MPRAALVILVLALLTLLAGWGNVASGHARTPYCCCATPAPRADAMACCLLASDRPAAVDSPRCCAGLCVCPCPGRPGRVPTWPQAPARDAGGSVPTFPAPCARPMPPPPEPLTPGVPRALLIEPGLRTLASQERLCVWRI